MASTITFINAGTPTQANSSPQSPGIPTNTAAGDLMLLFCEQTSAAGITFTPPAGGGWTSIARNSNATRSMTLEVFAKVAVGGDTAPSVACSSAAGGWQAAIGTWRNVNNTLIEEAADVSSDSAAAGTWQPTGITLGVANDMVLSVVASKDDNALNLSVANGYTLRLSGATYNGTAGNGSDYSLGVAEQLFASTGAKTCPTWNQSANGTDAWVGLTISLLASNPITALPGSVSLTTTRSAPTVTATQNKLVLPGSASLTTTGSAPAVALPKLALSGAASSSIATSAPTVATPVISAPVARALAITASAPSVVTTANQRAEPGAGVLSVMALAASLVIGFISTPAAASVSLSSSAPAVSTPVVAAPSAPALALTPFAPNIVLPVRVDPSGSSLILTRSAPVVLAPALATPGSGAISLTSSVPDISVSEPGAFLPGSATLTLTRFAPVVTAPAIGLPAEASLALTGFAPAVAAPVAVAPAGASLTIAASDPAVVVAGNSLVEPGAASLALTAHQPAAFVFAHRKPRRGRSYDCARGHHHDAMPDLTCRVCGTRYLSEAYLNCADILCDGERRHRREDGLPYVETQSRHGD